MAEDENSIYKADVSYKPRCGTEPDKVTVTCKERHDAKIVFNVQGSSAVLSYTEGRIYKQNLSDAVEYVASLPMIQAVETTELLQ